MGKDNEVKITFGGGFCELLFIVFLILKLTKIITWSWWWITAPLWGPAALALVWVILLVIIGIIWGD